MVVNQALAIVIGYLLGSIPSAYIATRLATGKDIDEAAGIGGDTILEILGGLPEEERHCAFLAAETLMAAIHEWMIRSHG